MSHDLNNKSARAAAKKKLLHALTTSITLMNLLPLWNEEYAAFKDELRKSPLPWLSNGDIDEIIYLAYLNFPGRIKAADGPLILTLNHSLLETLADNIIDLISLQRDYWFYFPLRNIYVTDDIKLSSTVEIIRNTLEEQQGLFEPVSAPEGGSMLKVHGRGYVLGGRNQSAFVDAMTKVKWTLEIATLQGYFFRTPKKKTPYMLTTNNTEQQDIHNAKWKTNQPINQAEGSVRLSSGFSRYLSELTFTNGEWSTSQSESLQYHVGRLLTVVEDPIAQKNVKSIRRALEWAFDAGIDEDEHMSFIKTCIGLEAAISEQNEDVGITEQLADRCAYLLHKTSTARLDTRNLMRKIYQLRSKLVHGAATGLSEFERSLAKQAEKILKDVLTTELKAVVHWYETLK